MAVPAPKNDEFGELCGPWVYRVIEELYKIIGEPFASGRELGKAITNMGLIVLKDVDRLANELQGLADTGSQALSRGTSFLILQSLISVLNCVPHAYAGERTIISIREYIAAFRI
ncbi:hypothetical protein OF83DRAFT_633505 [Amylostereum chailletii]|nr:hypothetical protein OF83DRAFT_633505 [Amylostereum chailletii]